MTSPTQVAELHDGFIRVIDAGHTLDFHLRWLRHNFDRERVIDSAELPDTLVADDVTLDDHVLRVRWRHDPRVSRYPLAWLRQHAYAVDRARVPLPPSQVARLELDGRDGPSALAARVAAHVAQHGAAVVRREHPAPDTETEAWIAAFAQLGWTTIATQLGRIEDLRTDHTTDANTDQLGFTDAAIDLHTEQPFLDHPPRYQLLQSVRAADHGGDTVLADAQAAFAYLASLDRDAAHRLRTTPVRFHREQGAFEREVIAPIITESASGFQIRSSYFTAAPYQLPFDDMEAWYRAHDRFVRILRDPRASYRLRLAPGDTLVYDNHRMVHGRTAFAGPRWVRGVCFDPVRPVPAEDVDRSG